MAMAGMAGTAVGIAFAVLREKADRRSIQREIDEEDAATKRTEAEVDDSASDGNADEKRPGDASS
jgi:hypothetical protein